LLLEEEDSSSLLSNLPTSVEGATAAATFRQQGTAEWAQSIAIRVLQVHQSIFTKFTNPATVTTAGSVNVIFNENNNNELMMMDINMVKQLTEQDIYHAIPDWGDFNDNNDNNDNNDDEMLLKLLHQGFATHYIKSGGERRHIPQLASLLNHFRIMNVLQPFATNATTTTTTNTTMKQNIINLSPTLPQ
jgi:hypothetical protein